MEGQNDLYYDEEDEDYGDEGARQDLDGSYDGKRRGGGLDTSQEKIEVNLDDIEDDDDQECLLDYKQNEMN